MCLKGLSILCKKFIIIMFSLSHMYSLHTLIILLLGGVNFGKA